MFKLYIQYNDTHRCSGNVFTWIISNARSYLLVDMHELCHISSICPCLAPFRIPNPSMKELEGPYGITDCNPSKIVVLVLYRSRSSTVPAVTVGAFFPDAQNPVTRLGKYMQAGDGG